MVQACPVGDAPLQSLGAGWDLGSLPSHASLTNQSAPLLSLACHDSASAHIGYIAATSIPTPSELSITHIHPASSSTAQNQARYPLPDRVDVGGIAQTFDFHRYFPTSLCPVEEMVI